MFWEVLLIAVAFRWTMMSHSNTEFFREGMGKLFSIHPNLTLFWEKLSGCPFCNGVWFGAITYGIFIHSDPLKWAGFALLSGWLSYSTETILIFCELNMNNWTEQEFIESLVEVDPVDNN